MQVGADVKCLYTNFGGCGLSGFRDKISFQIWQIFPFGPWTIVYDSEKIRIGLTYHNSCWHQTEVFIILVPFFLT